MIRLLRTRYVISYACKRCYLLAVKSQSIPSRSSHLVDVEKLAPASDFLGYSLVSSHSAIPNHPTDQFQSKQVFQLCTYHL